MNFKRQPLFVAMALGLFIFGATASAQTVSPHVSQGVYKPAKTTSEKPVVSLLKDDDKVIDESAKEIIDNGKITDDDTSEKEDKQVTLDQNMATVLDAAGGAENKIDGGGLFYGPVEKISGVSTASLMYSAPALGRENAGMLDDKYGHYVFTPYISFGYGLSKLRDAGFTDKGSSTEDEVNTGLGEFANVFASISSTALRFVKQYNPLPLLMSLYDNSYLTNGKYTGKDGNKLLDLIRKQPNLYDFFNTMGSPVSGVPLLSSFSFTQFIGLMTALGTVFVGLAMYFFGHNFGEVVRKVIVGLAVTMIGVPFGASVLNAGFDMMTDAVSTESKAPKVEIASNNLLFADWAETGFAMPEGASFTVSDGKVQMSKADVLAINKHVESQLGRDSSDDGIAKRIKSELSSGNNTANVAFKEAIKKDGTKWDTDKLVEAAQKFASNEEIDPEDVDSIGYLNAGTITKSGDSDANWTFHGHGGRWGVSPLTAVNVLSGSFDANGYTVGDMNTQAPKIPHVVADMESKGFMDSASDTMPGFVKFFLAISAMYALIKTLMTIVYSSYGGFVKGGLTAAIGSPRGVGELIGAAVGLVAGVIGISAIGALVITLGDVIWAFVVGNGFRIDKGVLQPLIDAISKPVRDIPILGKILGPIFSSVTSFVMSLVACMFVPKVAKMPIEQYGGFCSSLPSRFGELFQNFANRITGDYRAGSFFGGASYGGNNISNAVDNAMNSSISNLKMASAGAGLMAGATMAMAGRSLEKRLTNNNNDHTDSDHSSSDSESTRDVTEHAQDTKDTLTDQQKEQTMFPTSGDSEHPVNPAEHKGGENEPPVVSEPLTPEDSSEPPASEEEAAKEAANGPETSEPPVEIPVPDGSGDEQAEGGGVPQDAEQPAGDLQGNEQGGGAPQDDKTSENTPKPSDEAHGVTAPSGTQDAQHGIDGQGASEPQQSVDGHDAPEVQDGVDGQTASDTPVVPDAPAVPETPAVNDNTEMTTVNESADSQINETAFDGSQYSEQSTMSEGNTMISEDGAAISNAMSSQMTDASSQSSQAGDSIQSSNPTLHMESAGSGQGTDQGTGQGTGQVTSQGTGQGTGTEQAKGLGGKTLSTLSAISKAPVNATKAGGHAVRDGLKAHAAKNQGGKVDKSIQAYRMAKTSEGRKELGRSGGLALARGLQAAGGHATFGDFMRGATHVGASAMGHGDFTYNWATKNKQMRENAVRDPQAPGQAPGQMPAQQPLTQNQQELRIEELMGHTPYDSNYGN